MGEAITCVGRAQMIGRPVGFLFSKSRQIISDSWAARQRRPTEEFEYLCLGF
jgi:hypothetical protein